jgi:hypothetical protein
LRLGTAEMMKLSQQMGRRPRLAPFSFVMLPSMSISTEAKAKSLPARTGVTERTVIETMLDPVSLSWEPSHREHLDWRSTAQFDALVNHFQKLAARRYSPAAESGFTG